MEKPKIMHMVPITKEKIDNDKEWYREQLAQKVIQALKKNNMVGLYVKTKEEALQKVLSLIPEGSLVCNGGSLTLDQLGIKDKLRSGKYNFPDRDKPGLSFDEVDVIRREAFRADVYLSSTNALTMDGKLVNVDGTGNRIAALAWGPSKVIIVASTNKIVKDVEAGIERIKNYAAVMHNKIGGRPVPCAQTGECSDCHAEARACNVTLTIEYQREKDRITVIIVGEELGL